MLPLLLLLIGAQAPAESSTGHRTAGDSPPSIVSTMAGHLELLSFVVGGSPDGSGRGRFEVSNVPAGSTVIQAYFVTGVWSDTSDVAPSVQFEFTGQPPVILTPAFFDVSDGEHLNLGGYVADVSSSVVGNGGYSFRVEIGPGTGPWASLLCVVYEHWSLPLRQVDLLFGAESLRHATSVATVEGLPGGQALLHLFVEADDPGEGTGTESIAVNGDIVACCSVFNQNHGDGGSYFLLPVFTLPGPNTVSISTGDDWLGWHYVAIVSDLGPVSTERLTWGLVKQLYR